MLCDRFPLNGIHPAETLQSQLTSAKEHSAQYLRVGDEIVAIVDVLNNPPEGYSPETMRTIDHIVAAEGKLQQYFLGKSVEEYVERGAFIGPFVAIIAPGFKAPVVETVRLGLYRPRLRY